MDQPTTPKETATVNRTPHRLRIAAGLLVATAALGACSYASPDTASVGLSYTGGSFESKSFSKCVAPGKKETADIGGDVYYYPVGTRTWDFSNRPGADSGPILVSTKNNQELIVSGTISFVLDTNCDPFTDAQGKQWPGGHIQKFHDTLGRSNGAFFGENSTEIPQGWRNTLGKFLGGPSERAMDTTGGNYTWQDLYSDPGTVKAFTDAVVAAIPDKVKDATGGENYFQIVSVQLDKPTVPDALRNELQAREAAILAQQTANDQRAFAESFPGGLSGYQAYLRQQAETKCLNEGKCNMVPQGAAVAVNGG